MKSSFAGVKTGQAEILSWIGAEARKILFHDAKHNQIDYFLSQAIDLNWVACISSVRSLESVCE